jgi:hypothetical protein
MPVMMKSKPLIIVATIIAAIVGAWVGMNIVQSGLAQILGLVGVAVLAYLIYNALRRNRRVELVSVAERGQILGASPAPQARVLVYREGFVGKLSGIDIAIDQVSYAQLKSPQSVAITLAPGDHHLVAKVAGKDQPPFAFSVGAGETAIIRIGMGIAGAEISRDELARAQAKLATIPMVRPDGAPADGGLAVAG